MRPLRSLLCVLPFALAPAVLPLPAILGQAPAPTDTAAGAQSQAVSQAELFDKIRGAYYHPGKIALACDATLDFTGALAKLGEPESARSVEGLKLHITASDSKYADVVFTWPSGVPAETRVPVEQGVKQVIGGFFQAYWPIANAEVVPRPSDNPTVVGAAGGGYTITAGTGDNASSLSVESSGLLRRIENHPSGQPATLTPSFTPSPNPHPGDRMRFTGLSVDRAVGTMRVQATMRWDHQDVSGVFLPHRITVGIPGAFDVPVTLAGCTVSPDSPAAMPPK